MKIQIGAIGRSTRFLAGDDEPPKVLASVGATAREDSIAAEVEKAKTAERYGADIVIDHTLTPNHAEVQRRILGETNLPLSAIAVYDMASLVEYSGKKFFTEDDVLRGIEAKAQMGVDMLTVHASVRKEDIVYFKKSDRTIPCTSRGGTMVLENIMRCGKENFYWTHFGEILALAKKYRLTLSLGAVYRPASIADAVLHNDMYWEEIGRNAELVKRAQECGVDIMVEGIGHCPIDLIPEVVQKSVSVCHGAPYRVLTVATDSALGFDHVSSAIASATAVAAGASFVTAVSRSEHLGLPTEKEMAEAVISAKIAAHCGYLPRSKDRRLDDRMAQARRERGCRGAIEGAIVPQMTEEALKKHKQSDGKRCTMCGPFCALASGDRIKDGKK